MGAGARRSEPVCVRRKGVSHLGRCESDSNPRRRGTAVRPTSDRDPAESGGPGMTFDAAERATFAALADVLVPAAEGMPAASAVDIAGTGLDRVLRARPDLEAPLARILAVGIVGEAMDRGRGGQRDDPAGFEALALGGTGGGHHSNPGGGAPPRPRARGSGA